MCLSFMPGVINLFWLPDGVNSPWYQGLEKFPFTPGLFVFGLVWSIVHIAIGVALYLIMKGPEETDNQNKAVGLFLATIVLSASWPFILFVQHLPLFSTLDTLLILVLAIMTQRRFAAENKTAGRIMWIFVIWSVCGLYLNLGLWLLN